MLKKIIGVVLLLAILPTMSSCKAKTPETRLYLIGDPDNAIIMSSDNADYIFTFVSTENWHPGLAKTMGAVNIECGDLVLNCITDPEKIILNDYTNERCLIIEEEEFLCFREILRNEFGCGFSGLRKFIQKGTTYDEVTWLLGEPIWQDEAKTVARFDLTDGRYTVITFTPEVETGILLVKSWEYFKTSESD